MADVCLGKYEIRGELGRGAMGVVYRAYDTLLEREVALKTMVLPAGKGSEEDTLRFLREAKAAGRLHHPNIVTIHELGEEGGQPFIAMELMEGTDLGRLIASGELPPIDRRLQIVAQICDGLDFAHRAGIVHRDVKPANIFLLTNGSVKILDFGVAKLAASEATRTGTIIGTVDYMSPEQVRAERDLDGRSDLFAAGVILYELLFGRLPFSGDHIGSTLHRILNEPPLGFSRIAPVLPPRLARLVETALAKRREDRFQSAREMKRALDAVGRELAGRAGEELAARLEKVLAGEDVFVPQATTGPTAPTEIDSPAPAPAPRRRRGVAVWLGAAAILIGVGGALFAVRQRAAGTETPLSVPRHPPHRAAPASAPERHESVQPATPAPRTEREAPPPPTPTRPDRAEATEPEARPAPPARPGHIRLEVTPWARVMSIRRVGDGRTFPAGQIAPTTLELPPGRYVIELTHPSAVDPLRLDVEIASGRRSRLKRPIGVPGFLNWIEQRLEHEGVLVEDR